MPTLALLDGHSLAYRAFFALPQELATTSGQVTNSVYGFMRMLVKLLGDHHPDRLAVAWDTGRQTFRSDRYPEYKAQRSATPDAFKSQLPLIDEMLQAMGVQQFRVEGVEADDVIATIASQAADEGWDVLIVTGDRDSFQLVDDHVNVLYTRRGISDTVVADASWIEERYGIGPTQYVDYAALRGDTSDNLPGVPGVGEKTASKLLNQYRDLDGIYDHLEEQTPKLSENLAGHRDQVFLNRELMELVRSVELQPEVDELVWTEWDQPSLRRLAESLEFTGLFDDMLALHPEGAPVGEVLEVNVEEVKDADALVQWLGTAERLAIAPVLDPGVWGLVGTHHEAEVAAAAPLSVWLESGLFTSADVTKDIHHAKPLVKRLLDEAGPDTRGTLAALGIDTALGAYVLNPAAHSLDLVDLAERMAGIELVSPDREEPDDAAQGVLVFDGGPDLEHYGKEAIATAALAGIIEADLDAKGARSLYEDIEVPLIEVLARMEARGILVDRPYLESLGTELRAQLTKLETAIHDHAGEPFNVNSANQLRTVLFEQLGLPVLKKTGKGVPSTDASVLKKLAEEHPIVADLLEYREREKLRSTYVDGYLPLIAQDGRIHTTFNQMAAATGRLSSDHPNLQNIPVRSETGMTVRRAFIPEPGWTFIVADYSQIELRIMAHLSHDPGLVDAFTRGADVHTATSALVFDVPEEAVTTEMRRRAKAINFGLLYGMEAFGLADRLGISRDEAREHIDKYFERFPLAKSFLDDVVATAKRTGYTETMFGRRRYLTELRSDNFRVRQMGERMALNAPIQGTAADIIKIAMLEVDALLASQQARMLLQIHDELVIEAPAEEVEHVTRAVVDAMEGVATLTVPLVVDVASGSNLAECKA